MTKARSPLSIEDALDRIAGQIPGGKNAMATIVDRQPRTVRNWGDPETPESIPMDCAIALDIAFQQHGGEGAPIFETYATLLDVARAQRFGDEFELSHRTQAAIKEGGEAFAALVAASRPGSSVQERQSAAREVLEAVDGLNKTLPFLIDGAVPETGGEGSPRGGAQQ